MDRLKLAALGERLKTGGAQMSRMVSGKMKEILQAQTPESKMVDEATSDTLEGPNWGLNLRICALLNCEEFSGQEVVRAIKKKIASKNMLSQRLSLDLLEACAMNCDKVFSEIASEKVLDEMVKMINNPQTYYSNRQRALDLIQAWGESEDLAYLPVFRQTSMSLKNRNIPRPQQNHRNSMPLYDSFVPDVHQQPFSPPERYPFPHLDPHGMDHTDIAYHGGSHSVEEKKEHLVIARNSIDILSSILNSQAEPKPLKDDLTLSMVEKCKESQPVLQRIIETTGDDDGMLFEALNLHEELQQVISKYEEMIATPVAEGPQPRSPGTPGSGSTTLDEIPNRAEKPQPLKDGESSETDRERKTLTEGKFELV
ncbi:TOM1-like protein 2 [Macadamia integrifolia]|uniref:TOM1-like protein 2 n=1 Tax=Macadamia integrifolia TaxID=60698 RepID=UPI001C4E72EB|nr:TOM1-like protein 2 [Macadamia integrifolia]